MRWIREHRRFGSRLALFALALQIALSFGHVHVVAVHARGVASAVASVAPSAPDGSGQLPKPHRSHGADDYCAICASIQLLGASFVSEPPQLPPPFARGHAHFGRVDFVLVAPRRAPFQSRAPPIA